MLVGGLKVCKGAGGVRKSCQCGSWIQLLCLFVAFHDIVSLYVTEKCWAGWNICSAGARVMASHRFKTSACARYKNFCSHLPRDARSDSSNKTGDGCCFSSPLLRFSTSSFVKENFIWRHKSRPHHEVSQWLVSDRSTEAACRAWK